jgi:hypothetical protein
LQIALPIVNKEACPAIETDHAPYGPPAGSSWFIDSILKIALTPDEYAGRRFRINLARGQAGPAAILQHR